MKNKRLIAKIISVIMIFAMLATCAPITGFAANETSDVSKVTYIANTAVGVKINFSEVVNAGKYDVYRQTEGGDFQKIATVTGSSSYIDKTAQNGVMYTYYVLADTNDVEHASTVSPEDGLTKSILFVSTPKFTAENSDIGPVIKISPVEDASYYEIKRCDKGSTKYEKIGQVDAMSDLIFTDVNVENGKSYKYSVVATVYSGHSYYYSAQLVAEIAEVMTDENATDITYIANMKNGVKLCFKPVDGAESYTLYRMSEKESYKAIVTTTSTTFVDKTVENDVLYTYRVAVTGYYFSQNSRSIRFISTPDFTVANAGTGVMVSISPVEGVDYYDIKRHDSTTSVFTKVGTVKAGESLNFFDSTVENDTDYVYSVVAVKGNYFSYYNTAKIKTFLTKPVVLSNVQTGVKVAFTKVDGAVKYTVYRRTADTDWEVINSFKPRSYFYTVDSTAVSGVEYYYSIQADTANNSTGYDPIGSKIYYLESPTLFLSNDSDSVTIDFTAAPGAVSYTILRKLPNSSSYKTIGTVSANDALTFVDKDVVEGETYTYGVRAVNGKASSYFVATSIEVAVISIDESFTFGDEDIVIVDSDDTAIVDVDSVGDDAVVATDADTSDIINVVTDTASRTTGILRIFQTILKVILFVPNTIRTFKTISGIFSLIF